MAPARRVLMPALRRASVPARAAALAMLAALAVLLTACGAPAPQASDWAGSWRVAMQLPGGELPFGLEIRPAGEALAATVVNGPERIDTDEVSIVDDQLLLRLPGLETELLARRVDGRLEGTVTMIKRDAVRQRIPFVAMPGGNYDFFPTAAPAPADVAGRWAVTFTGDDGDSYVGVGEFTQDGARVQGTFLTPYADYRYLSGELRGQQLFLRSFNGGQAFLFHATVADGTLRGDYWSGLASHERFEGRRDAQASLGDAESATKLKAGEERLAFSFPDLEGRMVSLDDERFRGKVIVLALGGSWCPNCHDEAAFLAPLQAEWQARGVEVLGLMFERQEDFGEAVRAVERFRDRYAIGYPLLIAGDSDTTRAARRLPQLERIIAYPTTIFIDRAGKVRRIHTGFSGPATGEHHERLKQEFRRTVEELAAER